MPEPAGQAELQAIQGSGRTLQVRKPDPNKNVERRPLAPGHEILRLCQAKTTSVGAVLDH
jgi:hypothetical protein